jgi:hypothetical protein
MRSGFAFEKMTLLVLTLFLLFVFSACGGGKAVKSDQVAKDSGIIEVGGVKQSPQSAQKETQTEKARDGRFIAYDNGTVLDTRTNLMWAARDNGSNINWVNAKSYCENYRGGGYADWRMPTQNELAGLYDANKSQKVECGSPPNHITTDLIYLTCWWVWGSETRGSDAAGFHFGNGPRSLMPQSYASTARALPVRSGK